MRILGLGCALMLRQGWRAALVGAAVLAALCAPAQAGRPLVFAVSRSPLSLPVYVAEERGFFADEGVVINVAECDIGRRCRPGDGPTQQRRGRYYRISAYHHQGEEQVRRF